MSELFPIEIFQKKYMVKSSENNKPMFDAPQRPGMNFPAETRICFKLTKYESSCFPSVFNLISHRG